jgi:hypothetical protein
MRSLLHHPVPKGSPDHDRRSLQQRREWVLLICGSIVDLQCKVENENVELENRCYTRQTGEAWMFERVDILHGVNEMGVTAKSKRGDVAGGEEGVMDGCSCGNDIKKIWKKQTLIKMIKKNTEPLGCTYQQRHQRRKRRCLLLLEEIKTPFGGLMF